MLKRYGTLFLVLALFVLVAAPAAVAGPNGTERPFKAQLHGEVIFSFGDADCQGYTPVAVETQTEASGNASHLGKVVTSWRHCPKMDDGYDNGRFTATAANGDELIGFYSDDGVGSIVIDEFEGTGRFENAQGRIEVFYEVTPMFDENGEMDFFVPWPWKATLTGTISY